MKTTRKRSQSIRLAALGSLSLALGACDGNHRPTRTLSATSQYESLAACAAAGVSTDVCAEAQQVALAHQRKYAPTYEDANDCAADYAAETCLELSDNGRIRPAAAGFALTTQREVAADEPQASSGGATGSYGGPSVSGPGSGTSSFWRDIGFGADDGPRYYSEPIYRERAGQASTRLVTLNQQLAEGKTFSQAKSGRFSISSPQSFAASTHLAGAEPVHVSRGGFGSHGSGLGG